MRFYRVNAGNDEPTRAFRAARSHACRCPRSCRDEDVCGLRGHAVRADHLVGARTDRPQGGEVPTAPLAWLVWHAQRRLGRVGPAGRLSGRTTCSSVTGARCAVVLAVVRGCCESVAGEDGVAGAGDDEHPFPTCGAVDRGADEVPVAQIIRAVGDILEIAGKPVGSTTCWSAAPSSRASA